MKTDSIIEGLLKNLLPTEKEINYLCQESQSIFASEPSVLEISGKVSISGEFHGQYADLLKLFELNGSPSQSNYLFLGDYVSRGTQSLEVLCLLLAYKIKHPNKVHLIRGNHESEALAQLYGFKTEVKQRLSEVSFSHFVKVFDLLPLAAVINKQVFCVHGGISPNFTSLKTIQEIKRPLPAEGTVCDLLCSEINRESKESIPNPRGTGFCYGETQINEFLDKNKLKIFVHCNEYCKEGFMSDFEGKLLNIFSASNYMEKGSNQGALLTLDENCEVAVKYWQIE